MLWKEHVYSYKRRDREKDGSPAPLAEARLQAAAPESYEDWGGNGNGKGLSHSHENICGKCMEMSVLLSTSCKAGKLLVYLTKDKLMLVYHNIYIYILPHMFPYIRIYIYIYAFLCVHIVVVCLVQPLPGSFSSGRTSWSWCSGWTGRSWKTMHNAFNQGFPSIHICSLQHSSDSVHRWLSADFKRLPSFFQSWSLLLTCGKYCASCIWHHDHHVSHVHTHKKIYRSPLSTMYPVHPDEQTGSSGSSSAGCRVNAQFAASAQDGHHPFFWRHNGGGKGHSFAAFHRYPKKMHRGVGSSTG